MRLIAYLLGFALLLSKSNAQALPILGQLAPPLRLVPVDGPAQQLAQGLGRPTLIFYESKSSHDQNWPFKKRLKELAQASTVYREKVALFPIANLEGYDFWPVRGFVIDSVRAEAKRIGWAIYCDWKGELRKALGVNRELSSVILIDPDGKVVFAAEGPLALEAQEEILALLKAELSV